MTTRIPRNATRTFTATETVFRPGRDGEMKRFAGREQESTTFREARKFLDDLGAQGHVATWSARTQRTNAYARRSADGVWEGLDWLIGKWVPLD